MIEKIEVTEDKKVGVFLDNAGKTFIGWGYYIGDHIRPKGIGRNLDWLYRNLNMSAEEKTQLQNQPNPKIVLENGKIIWGCECFWMDRELTEKILAARGEQIKRATVEQMRGEFYAHLMPDERPELEIMELVKK